MTFDWSFNVGQLVTAVAFLLGAYGAVMRIYHLLDKRLGNLEMRLETHASTLGDHGKRMGRYEESLFSIVGDLQRVVGRVEVAGGEPHRHRRASDDEH